MVKNPKIAGPVHPKLKKRVKAIENSLSDAIWPVTEFRKNPICIKMNRTTFMEMKDLFKLVKKIDISKWLFGGEMPSGAIGNIWGVMIVEDQTVQYGSFRVRRFVEEDFKF